MDRKHFLNTAGILLTGTAAGRSPLGAVEDDDSSGIVPPYLKKNDTVGITAPAGYITLDAIKPAIGQLESWGLKVRVGSTIGKRDYTFGGTDAERVEDFQQMLNDPSVKAILCARGGYGSVRLIDQFNWHHFKSAPKWIIGFSDVTVIHSHLSRNFGIASIHSKMCNSFPDDWSKAEPIQVETILSIRDALMGAKMQYGFPAHSRNRTGRATGRLIGGNLKTIESLAGSSSDIRTDNKILFLEDTGEYLYSIDRMFWNLKRTGKLDHLAGLIIGGFKVKPDDPGDEFGKSLYDIVWEKIKDCNYPVCFDFPVGHQKNNFALKCSVKHNLVVKEDSCILKEI